MTASARAGGDRFDLTGDVSADNVLALRRQGDAWLASLAPGASASIELSAVTTASSLLLSLLLCWRRKAGEQQVELNFTAIPEALLALAHLNGVSRWLTSPA